MKNTLTKSTSRKASTRKTIVETDTTGDITATTYSDGSTVYTFEGETRKLIARRAKETGRTFRQYVQAAVDLGLGQLLQQRAAKDPTKATVTLELPAAPIEFINAMFAAAGITDTASDYLGEYAKNLMADTIEHSRHGRPDALADEILIGWQFEDAEKPAVSAALLAEIERWTPKAELVAPAEPAIPFHPSQTTRGLCKPGPQHFRVI